MAGKIKGMKEFSRNLKRLDRATRGKALERAAVASLLPMLTDAKQNAPVVTGTLMRSLHIGGHTDVSEGFDATESEPLAAPATDGNQVIVLVGTNLEYAPIVEFGGGNRRPNPYLRPAFEANRNAVAAEFTDALRDLIRAAL